MADRPIIFSGPMVRSLLSGRKSQTRRVIKPDWMREDVMCLRSTAALTKHHPKLPALPGDRLWVRETWNVADAYLQPENRKTALGIMNYAATPWAVPGRWRSPIFMPRWASRLTLTVTDVRVQRLQEISEADARAEGCCQQDPANPCRNPGIKGFFHTWQQINAKRPGSAWADNPWVCAISFEAERRNIDGEAA